MAFLFPTSPKFIKSEYLPEITLRAKNGLILTMWLPYYTRAYITRPEKFINNLVLLFKEQSHTKNQIAFIQLYPTRTKSILCLVREERIIARINNFASIFPVYWKPASPPPGYHLISFVSVGSNTAFSPWVLISNSFLTVIYVKITTKYDQNFTISFKCKFQMGLKFKCEKQTIISKLHVGAILVNVTLEQILKARNKKKNP